MPYLYSKSDIHGRTYDHIVSCPEGSHVCISIVPCDHIIPAEGEGMEIPGEYTVIIEVTEPGRDLTDTYALLVSSPTDFSEWLHGALLSYKNDPCSIRFTDFDGIRMRPYAEFRDCIACIDIPHWSNLCQCDVCVEAFTLNPRYAQDLIDMGIHDDCGEWWQLKECIENNFGIDDDHSLESFAIDLKTLYGDWDWDGNNSHYYILANHDPWTEACPLIAFISDDEDRYINDLAMTREELMTALNL